MSEFSPEDFSKKEILEKLHCITMSKCNIYPLIGFHSLTMKQKRIANEILNDYIKNLPKTDWIVKIDKDFNRVCQEEIFDNPKIDYTSLPIKQKSLEDYPIEESEQMKILT